MTGSKQNVTLAFHKDGTSELIHGPEVPFSEQRATVDAMRKDGLPAHIDRVEVWGRNRVKFAWRQASDIAKEAEATKQTIQPPADKPKPAAPAPAADAKPK